MDQLEKGIEVELEHRELIEKLLKEIKKSDPTEKEIRAVAEQIAKDHIAEDPEYYSKLIAMEGKKQNEDDEDFGDLDKLKEDFLSLKVENPSWVADETLWEKAKRASKKAFGEIRYGFVAWWYLHHGGSKK